MIHCIMNSFVNLNTALINEKSLLDFVNHFCDVSLHFALNVFRNV